MTRAQLENLSNALSLWSADTAACCASFAQRVAELTFSVRSMYLQTPDCFCQQLLPTCNLQQLIDRFRLVVFFVQTCKRVLRVDLEGQCNWYINSWTFEHQLDWLSNFGLGVETNIQMTCIAMWKVTLA